jgi:hypothetical protein
LPAWVSVVAVCSTTVARRNVHTASMNRARPSPSGPGQQPTWEVSTRRTPHAPHITARTWHHGEGVVLDEPVEEAGDEGGEHLHDDVDDGVHAADLPSPAQPHRQRHRCTRQMR